MKFASAEAKSAYFRELAARDNRVVTLLEQIAAQTKPIDLELVPMVGSTPGLVEMLVNGWRRNEPVR